MPTEKEIRDEIKKLKDIAKKRSFREYTMFGDNNRDAIHLQIEVLEDRLSMTELDDRLESEDITDHEHSSGQEAVEWLEGDTEDLPSAGWDGLH